jgi:hypothetical protein
VHTLIGSLTDKLKQLQAQLKQAQDADAARKKWSIFGAYFSYLKAEIAVGSCLAASTATAGAALLACGKENVDAIKGAVDAVKGCVQTLQSDCEPCKELKAEQQEAKDAEGDIDALSGMIKAAEALDDQLSKGAPLPTELPLLISDEIAMDSLRTAADAFKQELVNISASQGQEFVSDIDDWTDMGITRVSLFLSYYSLATRVQNDAGELKALQSRTSIVQDRLKDEQAQEAAVVTAAQLVLERQQKQAMLVTKYLYEEFKQFRYFSLAPSLPITLPEDPQSTDILELQQVLELAYQQEIVKQQHHALAWIYIEVNATAEPSTLASMRTNGSASVVLPIPLKSVSDPSTNASSLVADTLYYQMRLEDVGVYLLDAAGAPLGDGRSVQVALSKSGLSYFFDEDMALHVFSHNPIAYGTGTFVYDSKTGCPLAQSYCGELCPD